MSVFNTYDNMKFRYTKCHKIKDSKKGCKGWNDITHYINIKPDEDFIKSGFNYLIKTGVHSNLTVIDIDIKDDGLKTWEELKKKTDILIIIALNHHLEDFTIILNIILNIQQLLKLIMSE